RPASAAGAWIPRHESCALPLRPHCRLPRQDDDVAAVAGERARERLAEKSRAAGNDDFHACLLGPIITGWDLIMIVSLRRAAVTIVFLAGLPGVAAAQLVRGTIVDQTG